MTTANIPRRTARARGPASDLGEQERQQENGTEVGDGGAGDRELADGPLGGPASFNTGTTRPSEVAERAMAKNSGCRTQPAASKPRPTATPSTSVSANPISVSRSSSPRSRNRSISSPARNNRNASPNERKHRDRLVDLDPAQDGRADDDAGNDLEHDAGTLTKRDHPREQRCGDGDQGDHEQAAERSGRRTHSAVRLEQSQPHLADRRERRDGVPQPVEWRPRRRWRSSPSAAAPARRGRRTWRRRSPRRSSSMTSWLVPGNSSPSTEAPATPPVA